MGIILALTSFVTGAYLVSLSITVILELFVGSLIFKSAGNRLFKTILGVNFITHPVSNLLFVLLTSIISSKISSRSIFYEQIGLYNFLVIIALEMIVIFAEWKLLSYAWPRESKKKLFLLSVIMNLISSLPTLFIIFWLELI